MSANSNETKSEAERKKLLAQAIHTQVINGCRVESQGDFQAVLVKGRRVNHALHAIIGLFTFGLWWIVWLILVLVGGERRQILSVDEYGHTLLERV